MTTLDRASDRGLTLDRETPVTIIEHAAHEAARHDADPPVLPEVALPDRLNLGQLGQVLEHPALRAAMQRVAEETPEEREAARLAAEEEARADVRRIGRQARWAAYLDLVPVDFHEALYGRLHHRDGRPCPYGAPGSHPCAEQDPEGRVSRWWTSGARTLLLAGEQGRGKTDAAYAICNEVAAADRDGRSGKVIVRTMRASAYRDLWRVPDAHVARDEVTSARVARLKHEAVTCDLLLLDDLTAASLTESAVGRFHDLLDERANDPNRRTILTLNAESKAHVMPKLDALMGAHDRSRITKGMVAAWIDGDDMRQAHRWDPFA